MPTLSPLPSRPETHGDLTWMQALLAAFPPSLSLESPQRESHQASRTCLEGTGLPNKREESWRFTDLSLLTRIAPKPLDPPPSPPPGLPSLASPPWRLSLDTWRQGEERTWPDGIEPLSGPELAAHLGQSLNASGTAQHWAVQLNSAIAPPVIALRIRQGVTANLEVVSDTQQSSGVQAHRLLLVLEEGASLTLLQIHQARGPSLSSVVVEIQLAPQSNLQHALVSQGIDQSALLSLTAVTQASGSHYAQTSVCSGWGLVRQEPVVVQRDGQATTHLRGLHWVRGHQIADTHSRVRFDGPEGTLDQVHKVVAEAEGRSVFNGCIQVPRPAQRTDASQLSRSLLLSDRARIDTKPELEIVADDVRCSHGATISRLQQDELFYLQSRGLGALQASTLLLRGFCEEILGQLPPGARAWNPLSSLLEEGERP